jgi:hypothetical protein
MISMIRNRYEHSVFMSQDKMNTVSLFICLINERRNNGVEIERERERDRERKQKQNFVENS